jgi:molybdopterin-guanine dinucleotide biosynthesis protein A
VIQDEITGVVLIGGESKRMGTPKALIPWNGVPLFIRSGQLLQKHFNQVVLSHKSKRFVLPETEFTVIEDVYEKDGPMSGLISVLETLQQAVYILPCDMPLIASEQIASILNKRNPEEFCTVFYNETLGLYEPLIGIWEISSLDILKDSFLKGQYSFQKLLKEHDITKHKVEHSTAFKNIHFPEDLSDIADNKNHQIT